MKKGLILFLILILVSCRNIYSEKIADGYMFWSNSELSSILTSENKDPIYPKVISYKYNNKFIIIEQIPNKKGIQSLFAVNDSIFEIIVKNNTHNLGEILKRKQNFYIINTINKKTFGPFNYKEFQEKRKNLKINDLKFDFEK